jgi:hypothetical protein
MFGVFFTIFVLLALVLVTRRSLGEDADGRLTVLLVAGYVLRLILSYFVRDLPLFSHRAGGDCTWYEEEGTFIATMWHYTGIFFVTKERIPDMGDASLPPNVFALIIYANDGPTRLGCEALIAGLACFTMLLMYRAATSLGAERGHAFWATAVLFFSPGFLMYTSDLWKDGIVIFLEVLAFYSAVQLSKKITVLYVGAAVLSLYLLWFVRYYLVFVTAMPIAMALIGLSLKRSARPMIMGAITIAGLLGLGAYTNYLGSASEHAVSTFQWASSKQVLHDEARGASSVTFEDQSSSTAFVLKVLYTMFAPFPWQAGSLGFQIGKVESLINAYFYYRAVKAIRRMWSTDRGTLLLFLSFIAPMLLMYSLVFVNIGLTLRERLSAYVLTTGLAMLSWPREESVGVPVRSPENTGGEPVPHAG